MSFNTGLTTRISGTTPLDAPVLRSPMGPPQTLPEVDQCPVNAFGTDGGPTGDPQCLEQSQVNTMSFDVTTVAKDPQRELFQKVDDAIGRQDATSQMATTTVKQTADSPARMTIPQAENLLKPLAPKLDAGIHELVDLGKELTAARAKLKVGDPKIAAIDAKIKAIQGCIKSLRAAKASTTTEIGRLTTVTTLAESKERGKAWTSATTILADHNLSPAAKADQLQNLANHLKLHGGCKLSVNLLETLANSMQPEKTGVYQGQVMAAMAAVNKSLGSDPLLSGELAQVKGVVEAAKPSLLSHPRLNLHVPATPVYTAATDADPDGIRNADISITYAKLERTTTQFLGPPHVKTWFYMAENASGEIGRAMHNKRAAATDDVGTSLSTFFSHPVTTLSGKFTEALAAGNREIYNTIAPVAAAFYKAEAEGKDGMAAIKTYLATPEVKARYKDHPTYNNTDMLFKAFKYLEQAKQTPDLELRAGLVSKFNKCLADYEQRQVLQPMLETPDIRAYLKSVSPAMSWIPPGSTTRTKLLKEGEDWGNADTRLKAIGNVSDICVEYEIVQTKLAEQRNQPDYKQSPQMDDPTKYQMPNVNRVESTYTSHVDARITVEKFNLAVATQEAERIVKGGEKKITY